MHVWELYWSTRQRGTHAVVGVATADAPLHSVGYQSLVGNNELSWGWDLGRNKLYHDSRNSNGQTYPTLLKSDETFIVPDKFLGERLYAMAIAREFIILFSYLIFITYCTFSSQLSQIWMKVHQHSQWMVSILGQRSKGSKEGNYILLYPPSGDIARSR